MLRVSLFGGFDLLAGSEPLPPIPSRLGRALLAYLIVHRDRVHPREQLAALFWPDLPESRGRRRLSHTLWQVQDCLSELPGDRPYIEANADALAFNDSAPYWLDVEEFERRLAVLDDGGSHPLSSARRLTELERAVDLYRGEFLSGFYEDWVLREQDRLRERYVNALERLVGLRKGCGDYERALAYARRVTHQDPLREEAHREVMRLSVLLGRTGEALRQYERCRSVLAEELGKAPAAATSELYDRIDRQRRSGRVSSLADQPPPRPLRADLPFVGRDHERGALLDLLEAALSDRGSAVLVEGEPGVGKSRLMAEFADDAHWRGFEVLRSACREHDFPYGAVAEAIDGVLTPLRVEQLRSRIADVWLHEVARVVPRLRQRDADLPRLPAAEGSHRTREAFSRLLLAFAQLGPSVLVIEDLHRADEATLDVLQTVAGRLGEAPLVLALTYRGQEARRRSGVWDAIRAVDRRGRPERVLLEPLSTFETAELVRSLHGLSELPPDFTARLHRETGGNPLFVLETLEALRERGTLRAAADGALPLPRSIADVISERLTTLGPDARRILQVAAVHGDRFDPETLARTTRMAGHRTLAALAELLRRSLLVDGEEGYGFAHDQIRRVVLRSLDDAERVRLHRELAGTLGDLHPDDVEALAHHALAGELLPAALRYLVAAAERAEALSAFETAARRYGQASELLERLPVDLDERYRILAAYEAVLDLLGRRSEQGRVLAELAVLADGDPTRQASVHRRHAMLHANTDGFDLALNEARAALRLDPAGRDASLITLGTVLRWAGRVPEAVERLREAVTHASDAAAVAEAQRALGAALYELRRYPDAETALEGALEAFEEVGDPRGRALCLGALAAVAMETGDSAEAERRYRAAIDLDVRIGFREGEGRDRLNLANLLESVGRPQEALGQYASARRIFHDIDHGRGEAIVRTNVALVHATLLGELELAERDARTSLRYFRDIGDERFQGFCLAILGDLARQRGHLRRAREHLEDAIALVERVGDAWVLTQLHLRAAWLELASGDHAAALERSDQARSACDEHGFANLAVAARARRGLALLGLERVEEALEATTQAVGDLRLGVPQPWLVHDAHRRALAAAGRQGDARDALERARSALLHALSDLPSDEHDAAIERIDEHRAIIEDWQAAQEPEVTVRLAAASAPMGRELREDELVSVTLHLAEDPSRDGEARRERLLELVDESWAQGAAPTVEDLAALLDVSVATVYRDLRALRASGHEVQTRGSRAS